MRKEIIINSAINELRIAITEDGHLAEYFIELPEREKVLGNVYYGKIKRVIQGIGAAFIDLGKEQDAFLSFSDVDLSYTYSDADADADEIEKEDYEVDKEDYEDLAASNPAEENSKTDEGVKRDLAVFNTRYSGDIFLNLQEGKEILVQAVREPYGRKGMRVTTEIGIPGRYVVLLPFENSIGISKRIWNISERKRLRRIARSVLPQGFGCIIRTASLNRKDGELLDDWYNVLTNWKRIEQKIQLARITQTPSLVYQDMTLATSIIRDYFTKNISRVIVDSNKLYNTIVSYLEIADPKSLNKIEYYKGHKPIFEVFSIEKELARTSKRVLSLPSGGDIVIDKTEALTVIDVNSGRSNDTDRDKNALQTNLEAAYEITKQIRLRDIGGIIVVDFIDMINENNNNKLYKEMINLIRYDRSKATIYPITQLGLMQITRQRMQLNLADKVSTNCPTCYGAGRIISNSTILNSIEKWLKKYTVKKNDFKVELLVHPQTAEFLTAGDYPISTKLMLKYFIKLIILQVDTMPIDSFRMHSFRTQKDITNDYM
ncbi:MAG: Rne/Rng family ribonuclease [Bacteroidetes bacterium]|nr:Rne/Rng family ribonuclease [Bacteroidota bacterium]